MISIDHSPLDDRIFYKEALTLKNAGHELSMICKADETGVLYDMGNTIPLNIPNQTEVEFKDVLVYPIKDSKNTFNKALNKVFKGRFFTDFINKAVEINADVYHAHEPVSFYIGLQIAKRIKTKVVFDSHESYTTGTPKELWIKKRYLKELKYLITANHLTRGHLVCDHPGIKSAVIYNAAQRSIFNNPRPKATTPIVIAHDGYLPFNRGLKEMLGAFLIVNRKFPNTKFKIIGETKGEELKFLKEFVSSNQLENCISSTGWIDYKEVANELIECSIGIIAKTPTVNNIIGGPPIKYYNYTASGMAVVDVDMPETTRLLSKYKNGISVSERTPEGIAKAIIYLIENPPLLSKYQENSTKAFDTLNWENEGKKLVEFYENIILNNDNITLH